MHLIRCDNPRCKKETKASPELEPGWRGWRTLYSPPGFRPDETKHFCSDQCEANYFESTGSVSFTITLSPNN